MAVLIAGAYLRMARFLSSRANGPSATGGQAAWPGLRRGAELAFFPRETGEILSRCLSKVKPASRPGVTAKSRPREKKVLSCLGEEASGLSRGNQKG